MSDAVSAAEPTLPIAQSRRIALIVAIAFFMQLLDATIIATALPQMAASFGAEPLAASAGITVYLLAMAVFIPVSGTLSDRFGARIVFLAAIAIFTLASLGCGFSQSLPQFLVWRGLQGLGGALMTPVGRILVLRNAPKSDLINATALITWPALFAPVIGPTLGGVITTWLGWRWNFFINLPLGLLGMVLVFVFVPRHEETSRRRFDWRGFLLSGAGLAALLFGLETLAHRHDWPLASGLLVAGLALGWFAIRHLRQAAHPLLDFAPCRVQTFALASLTAGTVFRAAINATPFLLPLLFQIGLGLGAIEAGGYLFAYFLGNLGMKTVTTPVLRRFGFRAVLFWNGLFTGLILMACGAISSSMPHALVVTFLVAAGLSRSMQFTALNTLAFADIAPAQRSSASTLSSMLQQIAMLAGVAFAACALQLSQALRGGGTDLVDFQVVFIVIGAITVIASFRFLALHEDAGAEVSGHTIR